MNPNLNKYIATTLFGVAFILYLLTMAPTVSFWDCGEFIATSYIMGVPHPPGSPLFLLIGRLFSILPIADDIGARVNVISPITSAAAVMFLYLSIVHIIVKWRKKVENPTDALIVYGSAVLASLTFMVTDSHWFNAVEAEVYAMSTFLTAFVVWLILRWSARDEQNSHLHYILLLAYIFGLATGIHLLNLAALPFISLVIYFRKREATWIGFLVTVGLTIAVYTVIYMGVIKGIPRLAAGFGLMSLVGAVLVLIAGTFWAIREKRQYFSTAFVSLILIIVGYSSYGTIFIRSGQNPNIDENNPETTKAALSYLEREQYGDWSMFDRARWTAPTRQLYSGVGDFFWNYQVKKMYVRYFLWQFAGRGYSGNPGVSKFGANTDQDGVHWFQYGLPLALLIGLFGVWYHYKRDWKHALAVLALFAATGLLIILYLNQPDPQPRERDYSYVGSFLAWSIWIGVGIAGILEFIEKKLKGLNSQRLSLMATSTVILFAMPMTMLAVNYHEHDRSGNYVAWDYSYNLLNSCDEGGILFTNGDNDTFPLWYLQEVEKIRKDVRVVNLSLLNTPWYITQLREMEPKLSINLSDQDIAMMRAIPWQARNMSIPVNIPNEPLDTLKWELKPTYAGQFLRTQDRMVVRIINDLNWSRPIYFAVTVSPENKIGLESYLEMQGLVWQLMPHRVTNMVNIAKLRENLTEKYRYRNLNNPDVFYNENIQRLLQNLRANYLQLAQDGIRRNDLVAARADLAAMDSIFSEDVIPVRNKDLYLSIVQMHGAAGNKQELIDRLAKMPQRYALTIRDSFRMGAMLITTADDWEAGHKLLQELYGNNLQSGEVIGNMVQIYRDVGHPEEAAKLLGAWLSMNPGDQGALRILEEIQDTLK